MTTTFTPDADGDWTFGLVAAGRARLLLDGELAIDNWDEMEHSPAFFGMGSKEKSARVSMRAGAPRTLTVEYRAATTFAAGYHVGAIGPLADDAIAEAVAAARSADAAVVIVGYDPEQETEGRDRESMQRSGDQDALIRAVAAAQPNTAVVINAGCVVSMDWADAVPAIVQAWYPGQECGNAIADVVLGRVNACGKLPQTIPMRYEDTPALPNYPGSDGEVHYAEGVFVGYRGFEKQDVTPRFAFGHGLSYTSFVYGPLHVAQHGDDWIATVDITNVGTRVGKEVAQLYVSDLQATVPRPPKELKAFQKLELQPDETKTARFVLSRRAFALWDGEWVVEPGVFELLCGSSSVDVRARAAVTT
jgi:beta-glucosidase